MFKHISKSEFIGAFRDHGREDSFSYEAFSMLYNYFVNMEDDMGTPIELDVVAIDCEYSELEFDEIVSYHGVDVEDMDEDEIEEEVTEFLCNNTMVVGVTSSTIVYLSF